MSVGCSIKNINYFFLSFFKNSSYQKYFKNTGWLLFGQVFSAAIAFFVGAYMARQLGPSNYGLLNYVISFVVLFGFIANLGINDIIKRDLVNCPIEKTNRILGTSLIINLLGSLLVFSLIFFITIFFSDHLSRSLIRIFSLIFIFQSFGVIDIFFQSRVAAKFSTLAQIIGVIIRSVGLLLCAYWRLNLVYFIISYLIGSFIVSVSLTFFYKKLQGSWFNWRPDFQLARYLISQSWPLIFSAASIIIYSKIDQVMVKLFLGNNAAGFYAVAVKLSEVWYLLPIAIVGSIFPAIVSAQKNNLEIYHQKLSRLYLFLFWLSIFLVFIIYLLAKPLIVLLFGADYLPAMGAFRIYNLTAVGFFLSVVLNNYFIIEGMVKINLFLNGSAALINVILNLLLIGPFGIAGAAMATVVSYTCLLLLPLCLKKGREGGLIMLKSLVKVV